MVPESSTDKASSQGNGLQPNHGASSSSSAAGVGVGVGTSSINPPSSADEYMHQLMMSSNPSLMSQHHGNQNQMLYQNSLLDVASMMNPLQILPSVCATPQANVNVSGTINGSINGNINSNINGNINSNINSNINGNINNMNVHAPTAPPNSNPRSLQQAPPNAMPNNIHLNQQQPQPPPPVGFPNISNQSPATTLGGVRIPPVPLNASTAQQVQIAAAAAAAEAAPPKGYHGPIPGGIRKRDTSQMMEINDATKSPTAKRGKRNSTSTELTEEEKKQLNRDRNRQHARSTRLRKKAYVNKLKELVDGLHAERSEEASKRRVAVQHLAEVQNTRRKVISQFLQLHVNYDSDHRKWETILEEGFFLKQPQTPFRSFRNVEIEQSREKDCRISIGFDAMICDSASMSVMIESVGFRSSRWQHIKREEVLCREEGRTGKVRQSMPGSIVQQNSRTQHAISSLSSSGSSNGNGSGSDEEKKKQKLLLLNRVSAKSTGQNPNHSSAKKVSSSSSGGSGSSNIINQAHSNNDFHDYHAKPLPDPRLDGGSTDSDSPTNATDNAVVVKHHCADSSSSGEDETKRVEILSQRDVEKVDAQINSISRNGVQQVKPPTVTEPSVSSNSENGTRVVKPVPTRSLLPPNIARTGGISHNIRPVVGDLNSRLSTAPAVPIPPFAGIGKRVVPVIPTASGNSDPSQNKVVQVQPIASTTQISNFVEPKGAIITSRPRDEGNSNDVSSSLQAVVIDPDNGTTSSDESSIASIQAHYHINEDDMLITENVLMCPFIFRTQDAVLCGALAECVMPGMLRAEFSERNKLLQFEMIYDAMGFMQQLERASGNEGKAHIIPNSLETSLQPDSDEARVITTAKPPYHIVSVNERWTRTTKYTQMEAEKKELTVLHGKRTDPVAGRRPGKPVYDFAEIARGRAACCTNIYYNKFGKTFIAFVSSYPIANNMNEITHILHIFKELAEKDTSAENAWLA